jgi:DNA-binding GntR family transcriptional regulator
VILPGPEVAGYRQLADLLRDQIASGVWSPGQRIPSEKDLQDEHGLARETVRAALRMLRQEGLIVVRHGYPSRVREVAPVEVVRVQRGSEVYARPATAREARALAVAEGSVVLVVQDPAGRERVYVADRTRFTFS